MYNNLFDAACPRSTARRTWPCAAVVASRSCALAAAIGQIHLGHFLPDYTAYEELLDIFRRFTPIPILLDPEHGYDFSLDSLRREISGRGLGALLLSNPCNPTGKAHHWSRSSSRGWPRRETSTARCSWTSSTRTTYGKTARRCSARPNSWRTSRRIRSVNLRRADQELALSRLARELDGRAEQGHRITRERGVRFLDGGGSRPMQAAALSVLTAEHAPRRSRSHSHHLPPQAEPDAGRPARHRRALRARAGGQLLFAGVNLSNLPESGEHRR